MSNVIHVFIWNMIFPYPSSDLAYSLQYGLNVVLVSSFITNQPHRKHNNLPQSKQYKLSEQSIP